MDNLLSVIVPVYNVGSYLEPCIKSILNQTYKNIEALLIDDGSTDDSGKICDKYSELDGRVKTYHKTNGGVSSARNLGIEHASGKYIAFVDADDRLDADMYQILIDNLIGFNADVSACTFQEEKDTSRIILRNSQNKKAVPIRLQGTREIYESITREKDSLEGYIWNKVYKSEIIKGHKFRTDIAIVDDAVFSWEALKNVKVASYIDLPMYHYLIIPSSITKNSNVEKYMKALYGYELMIDDAKNIYENCIKELSKQFLALNCMAFRRLIYQDHADMKLYKKICKNCKDFRQYYGELELSRKIEISALTKGYGLGKATFILIDKVKDIVK